MGLYRAVANGFTAPSTINDLVTITGSASKIVKVLAIEIITIQTTFGLNTWNVIKRSSPNTYAVTQPTVMPAVPYDSTDSAATAVAAFATVSPSGLGTLVGLMAIAVVSAPSLVSVVKDANYTFDFSKNPIYLRGTSEILTLSMNNIVKPVGLVVNVAVIFSEESP